MEEPQCSLRRDTVRKIAGQKLVQQPFLLGAERRAAGYRRGKICGQLAMQERKRAQA